MAGVDSIVLLNLFHLFNKKKIFIAHYNYNLRNIDSFLDKELVKKICKKKKKILFLKKKTILKKKKKSIQMYTRKLRYKWFFYLKNKYNIKYIITAHHLNDNLETILLNFIRSTSLKGIKGIKINKKNLLRPLLFFTKQEIYKYALLNNLIWREDYTNKSFFYIRNIIRCFYKKIFNLIKFKKKNLLNTIKYLNYDFLFLKYNIKENIKKIIFYKNKYLYTFNVNILLNYNYIILKYLILKINFKKNIYLNFYSLLRKKKKIIILNNKFLLFKNKFKIYIIKYNFFLYNNNYYLYKKLFFLNKIRNLYINDFIILNKKRIYILIYLKKNINILNINKIIVFLKNNIIKYFIFNNKLFY